MTNARLEELRAKFQENPRRYFAPFANELRKSGDPAQAISICRAHLATQPGHVSGHIVLGQALYEDGSAAEARDVFATALELDPENLIALRTLGEIAQVNGEFDGARQWYQRLLDADPRNNEVAQLLRDLPKEAATTAPEPSPEPVTDEPTPLSLRTEAAVTEPETPVPIPASSFHTSFTGSGRAYDPDAPEQEPVSEPEPQPAALAEPASTDEPARSADDVERAPFIDLEVSAHEDYSDTPQHDEPAGSASATAPIEAPAGEMIDFDAFAEDRLTPTSSATPDEASVTAESTDDESRFGPPVPDAAGAVDEPAAMPEAPVAGYTPNDSPATAGSEPVRAVFAEHGFDGPADGDEVGWLTTPSAAYSDLEAAPEDWFETPAAAENEEEPVAASVPSDTPDQTASDDPTTDSWFDEVGGASAIEPTDVSSDELWLPPELPQVTAAGDNTRNAAEPEVASVSADANEATIEPEVPLEPVAMSAAQAVPEARDEFDEQDAGPRESEWQPAVSEMESQPAVSEREATPVHEDEFEPIAATWDQEAADSPDAGPQVPDESLDVHSATATTGEGMFVAHAGEHDEPAAVAPAAEGHDVSAVEGDTPAAEADGLEPAIPVYSASQDSDARSAAAQNEAPPEAASTSAPDPFITETLAELYLKQGFRDEALSIYRQLLQREPGNTSFRDRIASLESGVDAEPAAPALADQSRVASQSVRTFFSRLARRQPPVPAAKPPEADVPFAAAASALANMFAASRPNPTDESAASNLSGAFTDPTGRPSRAADQELSLDHLFREVAPREQRGGGGALSLDEFYSTPNTAAGSPTEPEATPEEASGSDIRQFTAWLEGLRKK